MDVGIKRKISKTYKQGLATNCSSLPEMLETLKLHMQSSGVLDEHRFCELYDFISILRVIPKELVRQVVDSIYPLFGYKYCIDKNILILNWGIYTAVHTEDWQTLTDALYTHNRLNFATDLLLPNGYNHAGYIERAIMAFAACDLDLVEKYIPKSLGLADKNVHPFLRVICNLIIGLYYKEEMLLKEAVFNAEKFVVRKGSGKAEVFVVRYLLALVWGDMGKASDYLLAVVENYRRMQWLYERENDQLKQCAVYVHGLYNLAYFTLSAPLFEKLIRPNHPLFFAEWLDHQASQGFEMGKPSFAVDADLPSLKHLFALGWGT